MTAPALTPESAAAADSHTPSLLFLCGSPRAYGNTMSLVESLVERATDVGFSCTVAAPLQALAFESTRPAFTSTRALEPCRSCGGCNKTGSCVIEDTMRSIYDALDRADGIVWVSPVYFGSVSAQLKSVIDRFQALYARRRLGLVEVGAHRKPAAAFLIGGGGDPFGAEAAVTPIASASHVAEATLLDPCLLIGVERAGALDESAHADKREAARTAFDALLAAARAYAEHLAAMPDGE